MQISATWRPTQPKRNVQHKHPPVLSVHTKRNVQHKHPSVLSVHTKHARMILSLLEPCCSRSIDPHLLNTRQYLNAVPTAQRTVHKMCTRYNISNSNAPQNSVQRPASHGSAALRTANSLACCRRESLAVTDTSSLRKRQNAALLTVSPVRIH